MRHAGFKISPCDLKGLCWKLHYPYKKIATLSLRTEILLGDFMIIFTAAFQGLFSEGKTIPSI